VSERGVALFHTTSAALRAEKVLRGDDVDVKPIPTPRELSSDCGIALRFPWAEADHVRAVLAAARVEVAGIHRLCTD
jgi:hypothetical protein